MNDRERAVLYASLDGATCADEGKKLDANPYPETSDLHFVWMVAWADARMKLQNSR